MSVLPGTVPAKTCGSSQGTVLDGATLAGKQGVESACGVLGSDPHWNCKWKRPSQTHVN